MQIFSALFLALSLTAAATAQEPVQVIVGFKDGVDTRLLERHGIAAISTIDPLQAAVVRVPAARVAMLRRLAEVAYVEIDHIASIAQGRGKRGGGGGGGGGNAPPQQTPPGILRVGGAVPVTGARVAIIDTGIDLDHPDLAANIVGDANFIRNGSRGDDDHGHGSHCAGTVAAIDNTVGVVGVAPNAELLAVKALDRRGSGSYSGIASAITWAASNGADVISMSLGGPSSSRTLENACNQARNGGALLVAAAGNSGDCNLSTNEISYPAYLVSVVSVGATSTESMDALMCFSNTNADVELSAPGHNVLSTYKKGDYATLSGTSMACPHVAGCAAVLMAGGMSNLEALSTLHSYADDRGPTGRDNGWGFGVVEHTDDD